MDEQLKRRLMGAAIVVALVVIFVPMLFEDKSAGPTGNGAEIPALPEAIEEKAIELPRSAADVAPAEKSENGEGKPASESGYRIVPLDDAPPKPAKPEPAPAPQAAASAEEGEAAPVEEDFAPPSEEAPAAKPEAKASAASPASAAKAVAPRGKEASAKKPKRGADKKSGVEAQEPNEMPFVAAEEPEYPAEKPESKAAPAAARTAEPPARKVEKARSATARAPAPKLDSTGAKPAPATEWTRGAEPAPPARSTSAKPAAPAPKPLPPEAAYRPPAEPATGKTQEPRHAPEPAVPSSWVVQAGSFAAETNARSLAEKLRKQNLPANVYFSQAESGPIYRVTVGPELNRARAEQIQKQIENAVGIKGIILPQR